MARVKLGDIFELETKKGKAYFQCVHIDKLEGELIKVLNKTYTERPEEITSVLKVDDQYFVGFPLKFALKQKLVECVGNQPLEKGFEKPRYMRSKHMIGKEFKGWYIIDTITEKREFVEQLTEEQRKLSPFGLVNDTYLKERIEEGWNLQNWK